MKSSILRTLRGTLVATTLPDRLFSLSKMACIVSVFCTATAVISGAQAKFTWVYSFDGEGAHGGANPGFGNLVQGPDGYLYGTTEVSVGTEGTVFKISTAGKLKSLYIFCTDGEPCLYGAKPLGGLSLGSNGMFYGTTSLGGSPGDGTVFQITSAGKFKWLYDFGTTTNGSEPWAPPILATNNLLYGTTSIGGSANEGTIYEMSTTGTNAASLSFVGKNGVQPYARLIQATNGTLYGTTSQLASGNGSIFAVTENEGFKTLHKFTGAPGGGFLVGGLVQASNRPLSIMTRILAFRPATGPFFDHEHRRSPPLRRYGFFDHHRGQVQNALQLLRQGELHGWRQSPGLTDSSQRRESVRDNL